MGGAARPARKIKKAVYVPTKRWVGQAMEAGEGWGRVREAARQLVVARERE